MTDMKAASAMQTSEKYAGCCANPVGDHRTLPQFKLERGADQLLRHLEELSAGMGHAVVRLDTNGTLGEAIAMYERAGYRSIERYNDNPYAEAFFEKRLTPAR
jgi:hypothetical protein